MSLAEEIAEMRNFEVLGISTCNLTWDYIFKKYMILRAIRCVPYGVYSGEDVACLKGQVNEKCNC